VTDDVRRWSEQLASDPSSMAFLPLGEALRKRGQLDHARKVALRGLERHADNPGAHDMLARILADSGDLQGAYDAWSKVLELVPGHVGATKGMAFIRFQQGELEEAERLLVSVMSSSESDGEDLNAAIGTVRRSSAVMRQSLAMAAEVAADPKLLFADLMATEMAAILLDADGLVVAGAYYTADGSDVAADVGATLTGVSGEAVRATKNLEIGDWRAIVFETEAAVVQLSPAPAAGALGPGGLIVLVAPAATPLGLLRRLLDKCIARARHWLQGGGAT
jgi:predicted regulator of Ras-like GTPase activity (Roadblock/LC7/MglB family)